MLSDAQLEAVQALRSTLAAVWGRQDVTAARERLQALALAQDVLTAAGEQLGAAMVGVIASEARSELWDRERAASEQESRQAATVAAMAAAHDGPAVSLDGGPSDPLIGAAEWVASVEAWARERV